MKKSIYLVLVVSIISVSESANILAICPTPAISHQTVFHTLMKDLANRGHQLTILTTDVIKIDNSNVTQIDLHDSYDMFKEINYVALKKSKKDEVEFLEMLMPILIKIMDQQLSHLEVKKIIEMKNDFKFDILIVELFIYVPMLAFAEIFDCPIIGITSLDTWSFEHENLGNVANPVIHPDRFFPYAHGQLTFLERWKSLKFYIRLRWLMKFHYEKSFNKQIQRHFPTIKKINIEQLRERIQLLIVNTHPVLGFIRPTLPNTIQVGFMHVKPPEPLADGALKTFLDNSKNGVIYMSLGSNVKAKDLSSDASEMFLNVFRRMNYDVLWKFENNSLLHKPDNVMISKWVPQSDVLAHPSVKLFITQGGQQSMEEAIDRSVPMVIIPFLGDQGGNARRIQERGVGYQLEFHSLTELKIIEAINEMMKPKYKENIIKLKELVHDQPMTSREKALWWTEYVIRHKGAKHLEYAGRLVPFYQRYWLDFIAIALTVVAIVLISVKRILHLCYAPNCIKNKNE